MATHRNTMDLSLYEGVSAPSDTEIAELDPLVSDAPYPGVAVAEVVRTNHHSRGEKRKREIAYAKPRPTAKSPAESAVKMKRRAIVARALTGSDTMLDIMVKNARWAFNKAAKLEQAAQDIEDRQTFEDVCRLREMADASAFRAAPYIHAKLAPLIGKGEKGLTVNLIIEDA